MPRGAGQLDRRITIQRYTSTQDSFGGDVQTWTNLTTISAARMDVNDSERLAAEQVNSSLMSRFKVRSSITTRSITPSDRISYDGGIWDIHGIKETKEGRKRFLEITAAAQSD